MTASASDPTDRTTSPPARRARAGRRIIALVRAELLLLVRNRTALFNAIALAPLTMAVIGWAGADAFLGQGDAAAVSGLLLTMLAALALIVVVYYNLTTTFVARREELVLKRLLSGNILRDDIVIACAAPAVLVTVVQLVLATAVLGLWLGLPDLTNSAWAAVGLLGGTVMMVLLAAASSGFARTVETAQLTTLPVLALTTGLSGIFVPLAFLPGVLQAIAPWSPMYPVVALIQHGLGAATSGGSAAGAPTGDVTQPLVGLALWVLISAVAAHRWMRWEPRR